MNTLTAELTDGTTVITSRTPTGDYVTTVTRPDGPALEMYVPSAFMAQMAHSSAVATETTRLAHASGKED